MPTEKIPRQPDKGENPTSTLRPTRNHAHNKFKECFSPEVALQDEFFPF